MKKQSKNKGFTLVELLVSISIMSILSSISIISYNSIITKANIANDISYVKQLNVTLEALRINEGNNTSMSEAIKDVYNNDFTTFDIKTKNYNISWLKGKDIFVLLDEKKNIIYPEIKNINTGDLFLLINDVKEINDSYSYCLTNSYVNEELVISSSIDIGLNNNIKSLNVKCNNDDYYIYTNNEMLNININENNDSIANIYHYGKANQVNININEESKYNEYGYLYSSVEAINIKSGTLIIDYYSKVNSIYINSINDSLFDITIPYKETIVYVDNLNIINDNNITKHDLVIIKLKDIVACNIITKKDYKSMQDALDDGGNILLLKDIELEKNETLFITKPITIDFYGHSIIGFNQCNVYPNKNIGIFNILSNDVIFTDSSLTNKGIIENTYSFNGKTFYCTIMLGKREKANNNYSLKIDGNLNIKSKSAAAINVGYGNCKLIINDATITSYHYGISIENTNNESSITLNKVIINSKMDCFTYKENKNVIINEASLSNIKWAKDLISNKNIEMYNTSLFKIVNNEPIDAIAKCNILNNNVYLMDGQLENLINLDETQKEIDVDVFKNCNVNLIGFGNEKDKDERILIINALNYVIIEGKITLKMATLIISPNVNKKLKISSYGHFFLKIEGNKYISRK